MRSRQCQAPAYHLRRAERGVGSSHPSPPPTGPFPRRGRLTRTGRSPSSPRSRGARAAFRSPPVWMVPGARIELATPAFSGRRSTTELPRHMRFRNCRGCNAIVSIRAAWYAIPCQQRMPAASMKSARRVTAASRIITAPTRRTPSSSFCP